MVLPAQFTRGTQTPVGTGAGESCECGCCALVRGEAPPQHPEYMALVAAWRFYELSYRGGHNYKKGFDADGLPVFVPHEQESPEGTARRKRLATYRNYCRPIADKFNSFVFGAHIGRDSSPEFAAWANDVDGAGTPLPEFMRLASLQASILGRWFVLADTTKTEDRETIAQVRAAGDSLLLQSLHPCRVLAWNEDFTVLVVRHNDGGEYGCVRRWTAETVQVGVLDKTGRIDALGPETPHGWPRMPIVRIAGVGLGESLISDVAEITKGIFNLDGLLREELQRQTFSQFWAAGLTPADIQACDYGARKVLCINKPAPEVRFERLAADPTQAESIRTTIAGDVQEIYRLVGLRMPDISAGGPESGRSLKIRFTETSALACSVSDNAERAEAELTALYDAAYGSETTPPDYPHTFDDNDMTQELKNALDVIANPFPPLTKTETVLAYIRKAFANLSNEERGAMLVEAREFYEHVVGATGDAATAQTAQEPVKPELADRDVGEKRRIAEVRQDREESEDE